MKCRNLKQAGAERMNDNSDVKFRNALGFAQKAGKLASGEFAAERALKRGEAKLVVLDETASENTLKKWRSACAYRDVPLITAAGIGQAIGKTGRLVAAVTDEGFSVMLTKNHADNINTGNNADNNADNYGGRA